MKIIHKIAAFYVIIALMISCAGYLSVATFNDIKQKVVQLQSDSFEMFGQSEELLTAIEKCQKSVQALAEKKTKIIYSYDDIKHEKDESDQPEKSLKKNLEKIKSLLSPLINVSSIALSANENQTKEAGQKDLKGWLDLRKKHFYYHWKYLSYFINLSDELPDQAMIFFKKTLEPHYLKNIFPIISKYRKDEQEVRKRQIRKIIEEYLPKANRIVVFSTLISLGGIFLLGFWISHAVSRPLKTFTHAAQLIGKGYLDTRIDIQSKDEAGILAETFNRMVDDLSKTTVSKSYVDNIIKSMLDTLIVVDSRATIVKVNKSTINLLGYSREELIGRPMQSIFLDDEVHCVSSLIDELISKGSIANIERTYITKDGSEIPVLFSGSVMRHNSGEIQGIVCVARDIIKQKKAEKALQKAYNEMERRVEERTAALVNANERLKREIQERVRTEKALRESENRLRRLSSYILTAQEEERQRISMELHDDLGQSLSLLKVQLSAIQRRLGENCEQQRELFSESRDYLDFIIENVRRISRDLNPSILEDLGLSATLNWLVNDFAKHYNVVPEQKIENIDDCFSQDKQIIIYRIFQEIFANIGKHAQADAIEVHVERQADAITFLVSDNGIGFDNTEISRRHAAERGIGLSAMRERALMLGAALEIETSPGAGTRIVFAVPCREKG